MDLSTAALKVSKNLRYITCEEKTLVYNAFLGQGMICHKDMIELIKNMQQGKPLDVLKKTYPQENLETAMRSLKSKGLLVEYGCLETNSPYRICAPKEIGSGKMINKLRLNVTCRCNMKCSYCYIDAKHKRMKKDTMKWSVAKKSIDNFFGLQKEHKNRFSIIRFFGGEPFLNWPIVGKSINYIETIKNDIKVNYIVNTNGTVFTERSARILSTNNVGVAISLDGEKNFHDRFRKYKSGQGTYDIIMMNIKSFLEHGCKVGIETTVGDHNLRSLDKLVDLVADLNSFYRVDIPIALQHLTVVERTGLDTLNLKEKINHLIRLFKYAEIKKVRCNTGNTHFPLNALLCQRSIGVYCGAMGGELCVHPNGDIFSCPALGIKLGTIDDLKSVLRSPFYHQLANRIAGKIDRCRGCDIEAFCAGGCAADAFSANGAINTATANCELEKLLFRRLVKLYLSSHPMSL